MSGLEEPRIPLGWERTQVQEIVSKVPTTGKKLKQKEYGDTGTYPVIDQGQEYISGYSDREECVIPVDDPVIIFGDHTRAVKLVTQSFIPGADGVKVLQPLAGVSAAFLEHAFRFLTVNLVDKGYARHYQHLEKAHLDLPPSSEQRRIVAKIEELFSELDKGVESLETARAQLKTYRQSLLKAAFEGRLTEQWRRDNADKLEGVDQLLERIREEREARYQQQMEAWNVVVSEWEAGGKIGKKPRKPAPPHFANNEDRSSNAEHGKLPSTWQWAMVGDVFAVYVGATPSRKEPLYWGGSINWISSGEVSFCEIRDTREKITREGLENTSTVVHPEGTVILAMIGEGKTRGQAAILRIRAAHNQNTAAIRVSETGLEPAYLYYYFMYRYEETRMVGSGNNQKALNKSRVQGMTVPLAPEREQREIAKVIEQGLSSISRVKKTLDVQIQRAEALRQSILKRAFEGKLVSQDPNDEPASVLLERIRREQVDAPQPKRRKRKTEASA